MHTKRQIRSIYFLIFAPLGVYVPYLPVYFKSAGLGAGEISILFAILPGLKTLTSPWWGHVVDLTGQRRRFFTLAAWLAVFGSAVWLASDAFAAALAGMTVYAFARGPLPALADTAAVELAHSEGHDYSRMRIWGSIGFIVASVATGYLVERRGLAWVPPILVTANVALAVAALAIGAGPRGTSNPAGGRETAVLAPGLLVLMLSAGLHQAATSPYNTFYGIYLAALGLPVSVIGASWAVAVGAEIVVLLAAGRVIERFGTRPVLAFSMAASALRWLLVSVLRDPVALIAVQILHAFTFGTFLAAAVTWVGRSVAPQRRATGQTLFGAVTFGLGPLLGTLAAGQAYLRLGGSGMFMAAAAIDTVAAGLVLLALREPGHRVGDFA